MTRTSLDPGCSNPNGDTDPGVTPRVSINLSGDPKLKRSSPMIFTSSRRSACLLISRITRYWRLPFLFRRNKFLTCVASIGPQCSAASSLVNTGGCSYLSYEIPIASSASYTFCGSPTRQLRDLFEPSQSGVDERESLLQLGLCDAKRRVREEVVPADK